MRLDATQISYTKQSRLFEVTIECETEIGHKNARPASQSYK